MVKFLEAERLPPYSSTVAASLSPVLSRDRQVEIGYRKQKGIEISLDALRFPFVLLTLLPQFNNTAQNTVFKRTQFPHLSLPAREQKLTLEVRGTSTFKFLRWPAAGSVCSEPP